jgi:hypothetical protein
VKRGETDEVAGLGEVPGTSWAHTFEVIDRGDWGRSFMAALQLLQ